jgi:protein-S-isoprenylcysteine O-methyltransferase Ste14
MSPAMSTASNAIKTGIFTLFVPFIVRSGGALLFVLGVIGYFWCAAPFLRAQGTPAPIFPTQSTVVSGPYRINRNPMYSSVLAVVFGQALFYQHWRLAAYGAALAVFFHLFVMLYEERSLRTRFDGEYEEFCRRVPRWIPRLRSAISP